MADPFFIWPFGIPSGPEPLSILELEPTVTGLELHEVDWDDENTKLLQVQVGQNSIVLPSHQKPRVRMNRVALPGPVQLGGTLVSPGLMVVLKFERVPGAEYMVTGRIYCRKPKSEAKPW